MKGKKVINVGMIGGGFMGKAHSFGHRNVNNMWDAPVKLNMKVICDVDVAKAEAGAEEFGWEEAVGDWRAVLARDDIDMVDICTPNFVHMEQAIAAAEAGKAILCEKPLANDLADAVKMAEAAEKADVPAMCGFTYRFAPAVQMAKQMVESGELGEIYHMRARYLQDWIMDPSFPLVWRLKKELTGSGALGDIGAHITDMALHLVGDIASVSGTLETFVKERPLEVGTGGTKLTDRQASEEMGLVTVDDAAIWTARFANGALGIFEATRFAGGRKNYHTWEINGSKGSIGWNFEDMNYLDYWREGEGARQGYRKVLATHPETPGWQGWWPDGHVIGYGECFVNELYEMASAIAEGRQPRPSFRDGAKCQAVLEAIEKAAETKTWVDVASV